ncbi:MAG: hypothetical protein WAW96_15325 [Alphaproteobacteria bacterium]
MPVSYYIDADRGIVVGRATGVVTASDIIEAFARLMAESKGQAAALPQLFKADERASHHAMDLDGLKNVKEQMQVWRASASVTAPVKHALVAANFVHDPVAPLWQAMTDADPEMGIIVRVFPTEEAALAWLTEDET